MTTIRLIGFVLAAVLHAAFALPFLTSPGSRALDRGAGDDLLRIEQGIAIAGVVKLGEAETTAEAQDMPMVQASRAQPELEEVKAVETPEELPKPVQETIKADDQVEVISAKE